MHKVARTVPLIAVAAVAALCSGCGCKSIPSEPEYQCELQAAGVAGCSPWAAGALADGRTYPQGCEVVTTQADPFSHVAGCGQGPLSCFCQAKAAAADAGAAAAEYEWVCPQ